MLNIQQAADYNYSVSKADVNIDPKNLENAGVSSTRKLVINTAWDADFCQDENPNFRTNGLTIYHSKCFLNCYLFSNSNDPDGPIRARALFHADFIRYFFPAPGVANTAGLKAPWTLPTENNQAVIREFYISALNYDYDFQKKPIIKLDMELTLYWAALRHDLYYPA